MSDLNHIPVHHVQGIGYIVPSKSLPGAWRLVQDNTCSCPAGTLQTCRHRRAVALHCAELDRAQRRPVGLVNPSIFVD